MPVKPPAISEQDLQNAVEVVHFVLSSDEISDRAKKALYYPLQQIPLAAFQREMLQWTSDKLKLFVDRKPGVPLEFVSPQLIRTPPPLSQVHPYYKRADEFTVLAIVPLDVETCVVFTSEISQQTWEIVGVFGLHFRHKLLSTTPSLVDNYDDIEKTYARMRAPPVASENDDSAYWNRYNGEEPSEVEHCTSNEVIRSEKQLRLANKLEDLAELEDDGSYWDQLARQPAQITDGSTREVVVRNEVVKLLVNLAELYIDLGVPSKQLIIDDIMSIAMDDGARMQIGVPLVAHRHAIRTIGWLTRDGSDISLETAVAIRKIKKY